MYLRDALYKKAVFKIDVESKSIEFDSRSEPLTLHRFTDKIIEVSIDTLPDNSLIYGYEMVVIKKNQLSDEIEINTLEKRIKILIRG